MESRKVLEAIFYVLRTGIQWNALPKSLGSSSAVHRYFRFWCEAGFFRPSGEPVLPPMRKPGASGGHGWAPTDA
jgi:hypothetical protein